MILMARAFLYSILSGILLGLANNELFGLPMAPLAWVALVPVLLALHHAKGFLSYFLTGYVFSLVYLLIAMFSFLTAYFVGGAVLIAVGALHFSLPFMVSYFLQKKVGWRRSLFVLPLLWPVVEWFVLESPLSMPLFAMYISQAPMLWLVQHVDVFGYSVVSFWLVLLNVLVAVVADLSPDPSPKERGNLQVKRLAIIAAAMFLPPLTYSAFIHFTLEEKLGGEVTVSLIQSGNAPHTLESDSARTQEVLNYAAITARTTEQEQTDLVIWPEGAMPVPFVQMKSVREQLLVNVLKWKTPLLTGCFDVKRFNSPADVPPLQQHLNRDYEIYNSAALLTPQLAWRHLKEGLDISSLKLYHKKQLMPFTEYVPFSDRWPALSKLTIDLGDGANFSAGAGPTSLLFATRDERVVEVSPIICWDLFYPIPLAKTTAQGGNFIAALTNESRLEDLPTIAYEVVCFTRLRSIETRRSIAKCATTGHTFFTDPFGRVYGQVPWKQEATSTEKVRLSEVTTLYSRMPDWFPMACLLGSVVLVFALMRKK
jgi:apolipoprotein N-acyltransferase